MNYYNEIDPKACAWLEELISDGSIPAGKVDQRSITDVTPADLSGFTQCHFFAGVAGWSYALALAGWSPDRPAWTGSCPCQPFSCAGKGAGTADARHLWPEFKRLIGVCRPSVAFGEQVASKAGRGWLAGVRADLEGMGYAVGAADLCAASASPEVAGWIDLGDGEGRFEVSVGPPHIRQRLFWVAQSYSGQCRRIADGEGRQLDGAPTGREQSDGESESSCDARRLADAPLRGLGADGSTPGQPGHAEQRGQDQRMDHAALPQASRLGQLQEHVSRPSDFWSRFDLIPCADGKSRRVESGVKPLVARIPGGVVPGGDPSESEAQASPEARVMRLRGYGNAINPYVAALFVRSTQ